MGELITDFDKNKEIIECSCIGSCGGIIVEKYEGLLVFAPYRKLEFRIKRLRYIWQIIKNGHPYNDYITLNKKEVIKLRDFINNFLEDDSNENS